MSISASPFSGLIILLSPERQDSKALGFAELPECGTSVFFAESIPETFPEEAVDSAAIITAHAKSLLQ